MKEHYCQQCGSLIPEELAEVGFCTSECEREHREENS